MPIDRYTKIVLSVIAISLAILAVGTFSNLFSTQAQAQRAYNLVKTDGQALDVLMIRDLPIDNIEDVKVLDDDRTFIIQKKDGITVYKVEYVERNTK